MMPTHVIVGAGGFGSEIMPLWIEEFSMRSPLVFAFAEEREFWKPDRKRIGLDVFPLDDLLAEGRDVAFNVAVANAAARERIARACLAAGWSPLKVVSPTARVQAGAVVDYGAVLCDFTLVMSTARVGRFFHANIYSYVAHDSVVGDFVTLAPAVRINGNCRVGDGAYLGTGATLLPGVSVGARAVVGAGAVVLADVPEGSTAVGVPARIVRRGPSERLV